MKTQTRTIGAGILIGLAAFAIANLVSIHFRSDGGILMALGFRETQDNIRAIGFPFFVWESGGFAYRETFSVVGLIGNSLVALATGVCLGYGYSWKRNRGEINGRVTTHST